MGGGEKRQPLGIDNLDSPDIDCIIPPLDVNARNVIRGDFHYLSIQYISFLIWSESYYVK